MVEYRLGLGGSLEAFVQCSRSVPLGDKKTSADGLLAFRNSNTSGMAVLDMFAYVRDVV